MFVLWGDTNTGKSTTVRRCCEYSYGSTSALYTLRRPGTGDLVRWEGFDPSVHTAVLLEEFRGQIDIDTIKEWLDRWPVRVRTFGGDRVVRPLQFWFTSNEDPRQWWNGKYAHDQNQDGEAFRRRITASVQFHKANGYGDAERFFQEYSAHHRPHQPSPAAEEAGGDQADEADVMAMSM